MNGLRAVGWHEFEKLISTIKYEIQCLEDNIFHAWMTEMKRRLNKMAVPALIESQSLPGFVTSDTGRFLNKIIGSSQPAFTMDDLLSLLNTAYHSMRCYYMESFVSQQVLIELLKLIGTITFNDLVMRRNFSSWKRGKLSVMLKKKEGFEIDGSLCHYLVTPYTKSFFFPKSHQLCKSNTISLDWKSGARAMKYPREHCSLST
jgi:myosin heavy subunit